MPKIQFREPPAQDTVPQIVRPREESPESLDSPAARAHAAEAAEIEADLEAFGIKPERVAPTRDHKGHVRLNFQQVRQLLGL